MGLRWTGSREGEIGLRWTGNREGEIGLRWTGSREGERGIRRREWAKLMFTIGRNQG